jgi:hypothetical protein
LVTTLPPTTIATTVTKNTNPARRGRSILTRCFSSLARLAGCSRSTFVGLPRAGAGGGGLTFTAAFARGRSGTCGRSLRDSFGAFAAPSLRAFTLPVFLPLAWRKPAGWGGGLCF